MNKSIYTEILAGFTTFCTMAYIVMINPMILHSAGMNSSAVFVATCLSAAFGSILMGLLANYPIALAPSMGMNVYFAYFVVQQLHWPWQSALGAVFISGLLFAVLTFTGLRQWLIYEMPNTLKFTISAGIGLFLGVIALKNLHIVSDNIFSGIHLAAFVNTKVALCLSGLLLMIILNHYRVIGTILLGILVITLMGIALGINSVHGVMSMPPNVLPTLFKLQAPAFIHPEQVISVILVFLFVALFDNTGTLVAVLHQADQLPDKKNKNPQLNKALFADSISAMFGAVLGTSTTGSYIESAAGVRAGGRRGITAITVGILFLFALFFAPLATAIPEYATAAALLFVAGLMLKNLKFIPWTDISESIPALLTLLVIPITFSIADGVSAAFVSYVLFKLISGKSKELNRGIWIVAGLCSMYGILQIF